MTLPLPPALPLAETVGMIFIEVKIPEGTSARDLTVSMTPTHLTVQARKNPVLSTLLSTTFPYPAAPPTPTQPPPEPTPPPAGVATPQARPVLSPWNGDAYGTAPPPRFGQTLTLTLTLTLP